MKLAIYIDIYIGIYNVLYTWKLCDMVVNDKNECYMGWLRKFEKKHRKGKLKLNGKARQRKKLSKN